MSTQESNPGIVDHQAGNAEMAAMGSTENYQDTFNAALQNLHGLRRNRRILAYELDGDQCMMLPHYDAEAQRWTLATPYMEAVIDEAYTNDDTAPHGIMVNIVNPDKRSDVREATPEELETVRNHIIKIHELGDIRNETKEPGRSPKRTKAAAGIRNLLGLNRGR